MTKKTKVKSSLVRDTLVPFLDDATQEKTRDFKVHREEAARLRHLEVRSTITDMRHKKKMSVMQISKALHMSRKKVEWYLNWSVERVLELPEDERKISKKKRTTLAGTVIAGTSKKMHTLDSATQKKAFFMRANAVPVDEIAELLGITEGQAASAIYEYAGQLNRSEINTTEVARRVQIEQLDMAIRSIMPMVSGKNVLGEDVDINMEVLDKFLKLMDQKAKLTGINAPQRIDITQRLGFIAEQEDMDIEELMAIWQQVAEDFPNLALAGK